MSPLYILEKIEDELTDAVRLGFAAGLPAFGLEESSFFSRSGIPDARGVAALSNCQAGGGPEGPNAAVGVRTGHIAHDSGASNR